MRSYQQRSCQLINTTYSLKIIQLQGNNSNVLDSSKNTNTNVLTILEGS